MTRLRWVPSVIVSTAIVATSVVGAISAAEACPLRSLGISKTSTLPVRPSDQTNGANPSGRSTASQTTSTRSQNADLLATAGRSTIIALAVAAGMVGIGLYRLRQRSASHPPVDGMLFTHPEIEYPELAITTLPQEAFRSATYEPEVELMRG